MARGNQRDKAREANKKKMDAEKHKNTKSGYEQQKDKLNTAAIMLAKQQAAEQRKAEAAAAAVAEKMAQNSKK